MLRISYDKVLEAARFVENKLTSNDIIFNPSIGVICGTGLSKYSHPLLHREWKRECIFAGILSLAVQQVVPSIPYADIPHYPSTELAGHEGQLVLGSQGAGHVVICSGRSHAYQGFTLAEVSTTDMCAQ